VKVTWSVLDNSEQTQEMTRRLLTTFGIEIPIAYSLWKGGIPREEVDLQVALNAVKLRKRKNNCKK
jgi:hypothetical protein